MSEKSSMQSFVQYLMMQHTTIKNTLKQIKKDFNSDDIHDFRVAIKRFRSADRFICSFSPEMAESSYKSNLREAFKLIGYVRDIQIKRKWLKDFSKAFPHLKGASKKIQKKLKKDEKFQQKQFLVLSPAIKKKHFRTYLNKITDTLGNISDDLLYENTKEFCDELDNKILNIAQTNDHPEAWHDARKYLKTLYYLGEWLNDSPMSEISKRYDFNKIRELATQLGDWHDVYLMQEYIMNDSAIAMRVDDEFARRLKQKTKVLKESIRWNYFMRIQ